MARRQRDLSTSTWFHVVNRGVDRQDIFSRDTDRLLFEDLVAVSIERSSVELHAYALMSNHFHMLIHAPDLDLSEFVRYLCGRYAAAYNQRIGRDGPLFTARFFSQPITDDAQLAQTARYIHRNPLSFTPLDQLRRYRWSSLSALCGQRRMPTWLSQGTVIDDGSAPEAYWRFVAASMPSDKDGSGPDWTGVTCDDITAAVCELMSVTESEIREPHPGRRCMARVIAVTLALELRVASPEVISAYFGADGRSVRRLASQGRAALARDRDLDATRRQILERVRSTSSAGAWPRRTRLGLTG